MSENISTRIKELYDYKRFTAFSQFADHVGLQHQTASNYVKGKQKPDAEKVALILKSFDEISAEWLILGTGDMLKPSANGLNQKDLVSDVHVKLERIENALARILLDVGEMKELRKKDKL